MVQPVHGTPSLDVNGWIFHHVETLQPFLDDRGSPLLFSPQKRFTNMRSLPLHVYGEGPFCSFRIAKSKGLTGVYILVVNDCIRYVGECEDLCKRFNTGYGNISPRNCYVGGQATNCRINRKVLDVEQSGGKVDLYFLPTTDRKAIERELLADHHSVWNGRQSRSPQPESD